MKEIKEHTTIKTGSLVKVEGVTYMDNPTVYGVVIERRWGRTPASLRSTPSIDALSSASMFEYRIHWTSGAEGWWYPDCFEVVAES
jgi:hypothetical protein